jgi:hypothetical protein
VYYGYRVLNDFRRSDVYPAFQCMESLKQSFLSLYREFSMGEDFGKRCRLLLDLFKMQIVFAGLSFG